MTSYNMDFLIAGTVVLLMVLLQFYQQRKMEDVNNRVFRVLVTLGFLDVITELISTLYMCNPSGDYGVGAMFSTTLFYIFQALLPFTLLCYIRTLRNNKLMSTADMMKLGIPTMILCFVVLTNPFTKLLFYFDQNGYQHGSWYMLMYYSALVHLLLALCQILIWRKNLGAQKVQALCEVFVFTVGGILLQAMDQGLLMTGFCLSLSILAMFLTINNPYANTDSLTGLYDKQYLVRKMDELIIDRQVFHVVSVNLYQLDHANKVAGMHGGDQLLQWVSAELQKIGGTNVYRTTGKRFLLLAERLEEYETYLSGLRELFDPERESTYRELALPSPVILAGIVNAEKLGDGGSVLDYAEYLESLSPKSGQTEVIQDDQKTMDSFHYNKKVEQYLQKAVEEDLFEIYYQPVYSTKEQRFITVEALSRLHHPELGWISPDVFIQLAEKTHLITRVTELQVRRVCRFLKENPRLQEELWNVKINLSPVDLMQNDSGSHLIQILDEYELPYRLFQFEITETVATEYTTGLMRIAESFRKAGIALCLDDFGSGYANLNTVMQLPFSVIKLDRSLLFNICNDERTALFYQSIVAAFQKMGYYIISEGVETKEEMELLTSWKVDMIQGYYFSRPLPPTQLLHTVIKD